MIEIPTREPCDLCVALRDERWKIIEEHEHVVPRQQGSDWGVGPPQLATFDGA
jgi:hypothetical protein